MDLKNLKFLDQLWHLLSYQKMTLWKLDMDTKHDYTGSPTKFLPIGTRESLLHGSS